MGNKYLTLNELQNDLDIQMKSAQRILKTLHNLKTIHDSNEMPINEKQELEVQIRELGEISRQLMANVRDRSSSVSNFLSFN